MIRACGDLGRKIWDRSDDIKDLFTREIYAIYPESLVARITEPLRATSPGAVHAVIAGG
jgi:hypothetical protein